jgi:type IV secretion system protein VirD4
VIIPALLAHTGPAVSTSTKPDVARATRRARSRDGRTWVFDPTGAGHPAGLEPLRWSPVQSALAWDGALLIARAMTTNIGTGTTDRSHWANRAQALLAPLLHAAAVHDKDMEHGGGLGDAPRPRRGRDPVGGRALLKAGVRDTCSGCMNTEDRERSSIFSAAADALQAYTSEGALKAASDPNFDPAGVRPLRGHRLHHAPAEEQAAVAPIVCGLLAEIRRQTYRAHAPAS